MVAKEYVAQIEPYTLMNSGVGGFNFSELDGNLAFALTLGAWSTSLWSAAFCTARAPHKNTVDSRLWLALD